MTRYHINPSTGNPGQCKAKNACPFGGANEHYDSKEEARESFEKEMVAGVVPEGIKAVLSEKEQEELRVKVERRRHNRKYAADRKLREQEMIAAIRKDMARRNIPVKTTPKAKAKPAARMFSADEVQARSNIEKWRGELNTLREMTSTYYPNIPQSVLLSHRAKDTKIQVLTAMKRQLEHYPRIAKAGEIDAINFEIYTSKVDQAAFKLTAYRHVKPPKGVFRRTKDYHDDDEELLVKNLERIVEEEAPANTSREDINEVRKAVDLPPVEPKPKAPSSKGKPPAA